MFEPLIIVISRQEIETGDVSLVAGTLNRLLESPETARTHKEKVDVAFHGYDQDSRELFEIPEVRAFVCKLDETFPFWLYFLSKQHLGLQALLYCFLPPYLTDEAKSEVFPKKINELLTGRWFPAMNHMGDFVGMSEEENNMMTEKVFQYLTHGRLVDDDA